MNKERKPYKTGLLEELDKLDYEIQEKLLAIEILRNPEMFGVVFNYPQDYINESIEEISREVWQLIDMRKEVIGIDWKRN